MATRGVLLPLRPDQVENLSGPAGALLLARTTLCWMLQGRFQQRPLHPGARRKDEEHCLPESIALRERSQFEPNNKVHNKLELCTLDDLTWASPGSFAGVYIYIYMLGEKFAVWVVFPNIIMKWSKLLGPACVTPRV